MSKQRTSTRSTPRRPRLLRYRKRDVPRWPRLYPVRWIRRLLLTGIVFPILRFGYNLRVFGRGNVDLIDRPCLVICNHNMHQDQGMVLRSLPWRFRDRLAIAAAATDLYRNPVRGFLVSLLGNGFPFNKEGSGVRESLETVAQMLDEGWHVLIFPEGKLTVLGPMQRFKAGTGYLAVETGAPVLPIRIDVTRPGIREGRWFPTPRAKVEVHIGPPLSFDIETSYAEATLALENAVREA